MVEVMDRKTKHKMMMMVMCGITYQNDSYLIYSIRRDKDSANVFVSKLVKGSLGYLIIDDFSNGEKDVLDNVVKRMLNKEIKEELESDGFNIIKDIEMDSNISFDIDNCYVSTVSRDLIKECLIYYNLVNESMFNRPVVEVVEEKSKFNEGFASNMVLIVFGVIIILFSCFVIYSVMFS